LTSRAKVARQNGEVIMASGRERVAWFNGSIVPESEAKVSFRDYGFSVGDGVFDTLRTFGHKPFLLDDHIARLYRSLRYVNLDPGLSPAEMARHTTDVIERNLSLITPDDDYWVTQWISRGLRSEFRSGPTGEPTVIIECSPLPFQDAGARHARRARRGDAAEHPPHPAGGDQPTHEIAELRQSHGRRSGGSVVEAGRHLGAARHSRLPR
jgi:branched-subunit amino acid aminotransferase/4-amino-4-deoxychorismate lyase